jgi:predicted signal transduction protein with EAL and GGDEF domain
VAEGIEDLAQKEYLQQHNCDILQGFLFGRSLDSSSFESLLKGKTKPLGALETEKYDTFNSEEEFRKFTKPFQITY